MSAAAAAVAASVDSDNPLFGLSPLSILGPGSIKLLGERLNPTRLLTTEPVSLRNRRKVRLLRDHRGLAEWADIDTQTINGQISCAPDPFRELLSCWCRRSSGSGVTVKCLLDGLALMGRYDILDDPRIMDGVLEDCQRADRSGVTTKSTISHKCLTLQVGIIYHISLQTIPYT